MNHERLREFVVYKEFRGFCYGLVAAFISVIVASALLQSSICFTAHKSVSVNKIPDCNCDPVIVLPAPHVTPEPVPIPKRPKNDGKLGILNQ